MNHLSQERLRERGIGFDSRKVAGIISSALCAGAQGIVCSAHNNTKSALNQLRVDDYREHFGVHLIMPDAQSYVRIASEKGVLGLLSETFGELSLAGKTKAVFGGGLSALVANPTKMMKTYLDAEVSAFAKSIPINAKIKSVSLHELLTELIVSFQLKDLTRDYVSYVRDSLGVIPGFVTRNFPRFVRFVSTASISVKDIVVMTPLNAIGFQMNPSKELCEKALVESDGMSIIAMSLLAAGYLPLEEAVNYLVRLPIRPSCVVGVSSEAQAIQTFQYLAARIPRQ